LLVISVQGGNTCLAYISKCSQRYRQTGPERKTTYLRGLTGVAGAAEGAAGSLVVLVEGEALETWRLAAGTVDLVVFRENRDPSSVLTKT
jgi:hypothetical protein